MRGFHRACFVFPLIPETSSEVSELTIFGYLADKLKIHLLSHLIIGVTLSCLADSCCHGGRIRGDKSPWRQGETDIMKEHTKPPPRAMWKRCTWKQESALKECTIRRCWVGDSVLQVNGEPFFFPPQSVRRVSTPLG